MSVWNWSTWSTWAQNAILNLRDAVAAWGERETEIEATETKVRWQARNLGGLLHNTRMELFKLKIRVQTMSDALDTLKSDFESYKAAVDAKLTELGDKLKGQLDPAKAEAIDAEINAAKAALNPPVAG